MPYRLLTEESPPDGFRRIAEEQIDRAVAEIDNEALDAHKTVHQVRKRCKKVRAILRLLRGKLEGVGAYQSENIWFRDAARDLSFVRDAAVLIETYDDLMGHFNDQVDRRTFAPIRRRLTLRLNRIFEQRKDLDERLAQFREKMLEGRKRVADWALAGADFGAVEAGLKQTYRRARKTRGVAFDEPKDEHFHHYRKRAKYHWYHCRLLRGVWRPVMNARRREVRRLTGLLGDDHDLVVFRQTLSDEPDLIQRVETREAFLGLLERRRVELRAEARPLGERLFVESPGQLVERFRCYWTAWRDGDGVNTPGSPEGNRC